MMVRGLLLTFGLDWAEVLRFAVYVNNHLTTKANKHKHTPHKLWTSEPSMLKHVHTFDCRAFMLCPGLCDKLQSLSDHTINLGPASDLVKHHHLFMEKTNSIIESCNVIFPGESNAGETICHSQHKIFLMTARSRHHEAESNRSRT